MKAARFFRTAVACLAVAVLAAETAVGASDRAAPILKLLNSRASSGPRTYAKAASAVLAQAREGDVLCRYVAAVLSEAPDWPAAERLSDEDRRRYLETARPRLRTMAGKGNAFAWYLLYLENHDATFLQKAVDGGNVQALNTSGTARLMAVLANPTAEGADEVARTCFDCFKKAADVGDANGLNNLGLCHQNGWGCPKDEAAALACFRKAAQQGHAEAVNNLGRFYREGICEKKDLEAALRCFKLSAGQGNVSGQLNYALAVLRGEGTEADVEQGVKLLETLASRGRVEAMDCLSECYLRGVGSLEADATKSLRWMMRARAARGDKHAATWLEETDETAHDR